MRSPACAYHKNLAASPMRRGANVKGFTLLELLVVIAIIGLLAAYVGPKYFSHIERSERSLAKTQIEALGKALDTFRIDLGRYPTAEEGLNALMTKPAQSDNWRGPYMQKAVPLDPWRTPYAYRSPGSQGDYDLISYGKDRQPGGTDDAADISNY